MVVTSLPAARDTGVTHDRTASSSRCKVHAPHTAIPQPNLVPVSPSVSRTTQRSGVSGPTSTASSLPLTLSFTMGATPLGGVHGQSKEWRINLTNGRTCQSSVGLRRADITNWLVGY